MSLHAVSDQSLAAAPADVTGLAGVSVRVVHSLGDVAEAWTALSRNLVSPGQSMAFVRHWVAALGIPEADQTYVVAERDGAPLVVLPLWRRRAYGVRLLGWFPGAHVGCNAPLVDRCRLALMPPATRALLWRRVLSRLPDADLVYLKAVPAEGDEALFAELGSSMASETMYRARFASWADADALQRSKSRRKHDRQQGEKLDALGAVEFSELRNGAEAATALGTLFAHRAARFREMGIADPFVRCGVRAFYDAIAAEGSGVDVRLHVLRLNGEIVAMRYNIAEGDTLFCLISSMSDDPAVQVGSPGKQCLLRVMQSVFDAGVAVFDMGAGFTDEKRHWCNEQVALRQHYFALTPIGAVAGLGHRAAIGVRARIKSNEKLLAFAKAARARLGQVLSPTR